jgi:hypothetical protein
MTEVRILDGNNLLERLTDMRVWLEEHRYEPSTFTYFFLHPGMKIRVRKSTIVWIGVVRPSRRPLRGLLRMRNFLNAIKALPHAEERPTGASRSTHSLTAALLSPPRSIS